MSSCLIGYTGFVGSNLLAQRDFDVLINSKNFHTMEGKHFSEIVCAGVSAVKWKANKNPEEDWAKIQALIDVLNTVSADSFVLISTIDVYSVCKDVDELSDCHNPAHHAYGRHHLAFEDFCRERFPCLTIVRLPGLFGAGLKKNVIYDLLNDNCLEMINPASKFQYYDLGNLTEDIRKAQAAGLDLVNFFTEPIQTQEIIDAFFAGKSVGGGDRMSPLVEYDMRTRYASLRGRDSGYLYSHDEIMSLLASYIERERAK